MSDGLQNLLPVLTKLKLNFYKSQKMTKKQQGTEVALANPTVNNQINMSLNQNDMIDVVIEHQLEIGRAHV